MKVAGEAMSDAELIDGLVREVKLNGGHVLAGQDLSPFSLVRAARGGLALRPSVAQVARPLSRQLSA